MRSRKTTHKHKLLTPRNSRPSKSVRNPLETIQVEAAGSVLPEKGTIEESADSRRHAILRAADRPNLGRHAAKCRICPHPQREEIEQDFVDWRGCAKIVKEYGLRDRTTLYRHAKAVGLLRKRWRNVRAALEPIIEQSGDVEASPSSVIAAVLAFARINRRGELIEPDENLELHDLFDRMTPEENEAYAKDGTLPGWFQNEIAAAGGRVPKGDENA